MKHLALIAVALVALSLAAHTAQPHLAVLRATIGPYPLASYPQGSNAVITVYKSTSLGTTWTPFKPTAVFPATRTNQSLVVVAPNTFRFYCAATIQPYGEGNPSTTVTNNLSSLALAGSVSFAATATKHETPTRFHSVPARAGHRF